MVANHLFPETTHYNGLAIFLLQKIEVTLEGGGVWISYIPFSLGSNAPFNFQYSDTFNVNFAPSILPTPKTKTKMV